MKNLSKTQNPSWTAWQKTCWTHHIVESRWMQKYSGVSEDDLTSESCNFSWLPVIFLVRERMWWNRHQFLMVPVHPLAVPTLRAPSWTGTEASEAGFGSTSTFWVHILSPLESEKLQKLLGFQWLLWKSSQNSCVFTHWGDRELMDIYVDWCVTTVSRVIQLNSRKNSSSIGWFLLI